MTTINSTSPSRPTDVRQPAQRHDAVDGDATRFESVAEIGGWMRTAFLGVFAPEILIDDIGEARHEVIGIAGAFQRSPNQPGVARL
jgi:hypothetical protein